MSFCLEKDWKHLEGSELRSGTIQHNGSQAPSGCSVQERGRGRSTDTERALLMECVWTKRERGSPGKAGQPLPLLRFPELPKFLLHLKTLLFSFSSSVLPIKLPLY